MSPQSGLNTVKSVFWNPTERRFRALVRILLAVVLLIATIAVVNAALTALTEQTQIPLILFVLTIVGQATPIPAVLLAGYGIDRRVLADLGLGIDRDWWVDLAFGSILGGTLMTGIFAVALVTGWIRIDDTFVVEGLGSGSPGHLS